MAKNILGSDLAPCSFDPKTGFMRDGHCHLIGEDRGMHTLCAVMTDEFLQFSRDRGNDLITPRPEYDFPGLKAGDHWCLCLSRWKEAHDLGVIAPVVLEATHSSVLEFVDRAELESAAWKE